jgi:hypothetical protein
MAPNLLKNPGFELPSLPPTSSTGAAVPGSSAAPNWTTWNNSQATTTTDILPSTRPGGGAHMIHVCTTGQDNGLVQVFLPHNTGPQHARSTVWVFVLRGKVGMGTGNGGSTGDHDAQSTQIGKWQQLQAPNGVAPANEFIVYATSPGGACFYIDDASVIAP